MNVIFNQTHWHGYCLQSLAESKGLPLDSIAGAEIYSAVYEKLKADKYQTISLSFCESKKRLAQWLESFFHSQHISSQSKILSIGCGMGLVESPLRKVGFEIDLQECQEQSFDYMMKRYPVEFKKSKLIISQDLESINNQTYDCVMAITSTYPLEERQLSSFLASVSRVLKKGGIFIWYDTSYNFSHLFHQIYWFLRNTKHAGIPWGYKRCLKHWNRKVKQTDLAYETYFYFDKENHLLESKRLLGLPLNNKTAWQMGIYRKH